eukprot:2756403-Rhodomonas_salina.1
MDPAQTKSVDDDGGGTNAVIADARRPPITLSLAPSGIFEPHKVATGLAAKVTDGERNADCFAKFRGQHPWTGTCGSKPVRFAGGRK